VKGIVSKRSQTVPTNPGQPIIWSAAISALFDDGLSFRSLIKEHYKRKKGFFTSRYTFIFSARFKTITCLDAFLNTKIGNHHF
jgi:hypothetical protein